MWEDKSPSSVVSSWLITGDDLKASNSFAAPNASRRKLFGKLSSGSSRTTFEVRRVPTLSSSAVSVGLGIFQGLSVDR